MNFYPIIIVSIFLFGVAISIWGWRILAQSKTMRQWPTVTGQIKSAQMGGGDDDLLPHIIFTYEINGQAYERVFEFPEGTAPLPEFSAAYLDKYPAGAQVPVYHHPEDPSNATLEHSSQGDWMVLALGLMMAIGAVVVMAVDF